jgi:hypothetical protein
MPDRHRLVWGLIKPEHITTAMSLVDQGKARPRGQARSLVLRHQGKDYPAKFITTVAYLLAAGKPLTDKVDFTSGDGLIDSFRRRGFTIERLAPESGAEA